MGKRVKFHTEIKCLDSSMLDGVKYDANAEVLEATFKGKDESPRYRYYGVPAQLFAELVTAKSMGQTFNELVKGSYPRRKFA